MVPLSDQDTMTTTEVATYLGLASRGAALSWLYRRGIQAVSRQPGWGENLYPAEFVKTHASRGPWRTHPTYDRWRDDQGTPIPEGCRVEQIEVHRKHGGARRRLGTRGVVISRGRTRLRVRFDGQDTPVSIHPRLVRALAAEAGTPPLSIEPQDPLV